MIKVSNVVSLSSIISTTCVIPSQLLEVEHVCIADSTVVPVVKDTPPNCLNPATYRLKNNA